MVRWMHSWSHIFLWLPGHMKSRDKLKPKYFFLQKTYGHRTLQSADVWWDKAHNDVTWPWSCDHKRSRAKLRTEIPFLQGLYHQSWQGGDLWGQKAMHGVTWLHDYADLWGHMKNLKRNISFSARLMAPTLVNWKGSTHKTKWLLNQVVTRQMKKLKIENYNQETFNRNITIGNVYCFNHSIKIRRQIYSSNKMYQKRKKQIKSRKKRATIVKIVAEKLK